MSTYTTTPGRTGSSLARRTGYAIAAVVNAGLLYAANVWPGWQVLPFLSEDTPLVLALVNVSLIVGIIVNAVYLVLDQPAVKAAGDLVTLGIGLAALVRLWQVFPFDFGDSVFDWTLLLRIVFGVTIAGTVIGLIVQIVVLIRRLLGFPGPV